MEKDIDAIQLLSELNLYNEQVISELEDEHIEKGSSKKPAKMKIKVVREISPSHYICKSPAKSKKFSIFTSLEVLNRNSDLFHRNKNSVPAIIKAIYTPEEIKELIETSNSTSFDNFVSKVKKAVKGSNKGMYINSVASNVLKFVEEVENNQEISFEDQTINDRHLNPQLREYDNGPQSLVHQVTSVYGDNRYYNQVNAYLSVLTPMFAKFDSEKEADSKIAEIEKHIKEAYGFGFKYGSKSKRNLITRTISLDKKSTKMDSCINMLYSIAKSFKGSKVVDLKEAKKAVTKDERIDFLSSRKAVVDNKRKKVKKIFKSHKETINDVVATLTTIFMARFCFDSKHFAQIERDLSEQAANKMKYLSFSNNPNQDYWVNHIIQEHLKKNIAKVCAANNITSAEELLQIYNLNGTKIVNTSEITSINDLVFSVQYNTNGPVQNKELTNLPKKQIKAKKVLKNNKKKVKAPIFTRLKSNKFLDTVRKTETYKKHYEHYLNMFRQMAIAKTEENAMEIESIKEAAEANLESLQKLAKKDLTEHDKKAFADTLASVDATTNFCDEFSTRAEEDDNNSYLKKLESILGPSLKISKDVEEIKEEPVIISDEIAGEMFEEVDSSKGVLPEHSVYMPIIEEDLEEVEGKEAPVQLSIDDYMKQLEQEEGEEIVVETVEVKEEKEEIIEDKPLTFKTTKTLNNLSEEEFKAKAVKYLNKLIYGSNGKVGLISEKLNYRIIEKKQTKKDSVNDSERLDDTQFSKANKIRDKIINAYVQDYAEEMYKVLMAKSITGTDEMTMAKYCAEFTKQVLGVEAKSFTAKDLKNVLSYAITKIVNPNLKDLNLELYTGKKTYKKYNDFFEEKSKEQNMEY